MYIYISYIMFLLWNWLLGPLMNMESQNYKQPMDIIGCWSSLHDDEVAGSCWHRGLITSVQQHGHVLQLTGLSKRSKVRMLCNLNSTQIGAFPKWSILMQQPVLFWGQLIWPSHPSKWWETAVPCSLILPASWTLTFKEPRGTSFSEVFCSSFSQVQELVVWNLSKAKPVELIEVHSTNIFTDIVVR